jgi:NADPH:quinone reductase-like Zn-dependent oxidoreductase
VQAITYHRYGPPDVLRLEEVDDPVATDDQVLVRVHAAAANPRDWHLMRGLPYSSGRSSGCAGRGARCSAATSPGGSRRSAGP